MNHSLRFKCFAKLVSANKQFRDLYALRSCSIQAVWFLLWLRRCFTCSSRELWALDIPHCFHCITQIYEELDLGKPSLSLLYDAWGDWCWGIHCKIAKTPWKRSSLLLPLMRYVFRHTFVSISFRMLWNKTLNFRSHWILEAITQ
jgi:hypothetical protein